MTRDWLAIALSIVSLLVAYSAYLIAKADRPRPYVRVSPTFYEQSGYVGIHMRTEAMSGVSARLIYEQANIGSDIGLSGMNLHSKRGNDIVFQGLDAGWDREFQPIPPEISIPIRDGTQRLRLGTCVVYAALLHDDTRTWEIDALYEYQPGLSVARVLDTQDRSRSVGSGTCDPRAFASDWERERPQANSVRSTDAR